MEDKEKINIVNKMAEKRFITEEEKSLLEVRNGKIWDDTKFVGIAEICEDGNVVIHGRGSYPQVISVNDILK